MLLEFTVGRAAGVGQAHILVSQITDVRQATDSDEVEVGLRSGRSLYVRESVEDILDALSYVTRHISTSPGIVDKIDGEHEEVYPWRRREKVSALAAKWRNHTETLRRGSENNPLLNYVPVVDPDIPLSPLPPETVRRLRQQRVDAVRAAAMPLTDETGRVRKLTPEQAELLKPNKARGDLVNEVMVPETCDSELDAEFNQAVEEALGVTIPPSPRPMTDADRHALTQDELETLPTEERSRLVGEYLQRENIDPSLPSVGHGRHQEPPVVDPPEFPEDLNDPRR